MSKKIIIPNQMHKNKYLLFIGEGKKKEWSSHMCLKTDQDKEVPKYRDHSDNYH